MKKIVLYGDSNTYGYDPAGMFDRRYPAEHHWPDLLKATGKWDIRAYGENGRQIPQSKADYAWLEQILMNTHPFDLFVILLGSNDLLYQYDPKMEIITVRMDRLLSHLTAHHYFLESGAGILLLAPPPFQVPEQMYEAHNVVSQKYATEYQTLAKSHGTYFADTGGWQIQTAFDAVHFTPKGHLTFATHMEKVLDDIFR